MGCFSWMFSDYNNALPLNIGMPCYLMCPDGNAIYEPSYDGYGHFSGHDVFSLVVDWNHEEIRHYLEQSVHKSLCSWHESFLILVENDLFEAERNAGLFFHDNEWLLREWKRTLGIDIACYDDQNLSLKYPIKITTTPKIHYEMLPASLSDVNQGFGE